MYAYVVIAILEIYARIITVSRILVKMVEHVIFRLQTHKATHADVALAFMEITVSIIAAS